MNVRKLCFFTFQISSLALGFITELRALLGAYLLTRKMLLCGVCV